MGREGLYVALRGCSGVSSSPSIKGSAADMPLSSWPASKLGPCEGKARREAGQIQQRRTEHSTAGDLQGKRESALNFKAPQGLANRPHIGHTATVYVSLNH